MCYSGSLEEKHLCVQPGAAEDINIRCSYGEQIRVIDFYTGRRLTQQDDFCSQPIPANSDCSNRQTDQNEDLRATCNARRTCETTVTYPASDTCDSIFSDQTYVTVVYECRPSKLQYHHSTNNDKRFLSVKPEKCPTRFCTLSVAASGINRDNANSCIFCVS